MDEEKVQLGEEQNTWLMGPAGRMPSESPCLEEWEGARTDRKRKDLRQTGAARA